MSLRMPIITVLIGYGGSGGALALCVADRIAILENAVLYVISPKACAEILWKDTSKEIEAAKLPKMTLSDMLQQSLDDYIIPESNHGAHSNAREMAMRMIKAYLVKELGALKKIRTFILVKQSQRKFRAIGKKDERFE